MADEDIVLGEQGANKGMSKIKLMIIAVVALVLIGGGSGLAYYLLADDESPETAEEIAKSSQELALAESDSGLSATYVAMPRPFVFNVIDGKRDRLVQIKVQLMVRGAEHEKLAKKHVPLLEGTLVRIFSAATAAQLRSPDGKDQLREYAQKALNESISKLEGKAIIDTVLFTGFVLQ